MPKKQAEVRHIAPRHVGIAVVTILTLASAQGVGQSPSLRVISATPVGELAQINDADQIRIIFSEAMVPIGTVPAGVPPSWIRMSPAAAGSFYWSGTRTLIFSPDAAAPLPYATRFTVRIDGSATSVSGRTLATPYEFTFTTPTVRLLEAEWYRKTDRFDSPAIIALRFNQRVRPDDVLAHVRVALTPYKWEAPTLPARTRERWQRTDAAGLRRFDDKVEGVRRVTSRSDRVGVVAAQSWDEERFPRTPNRVVLETTTAPAPDTRLTVSLDALPSLDGPEVHAPRSTVLKLEPTFFVRGTPCTEACDPFDYNPLSLTAFVSLPTIAQMLEVVDVTSPGAERPITPTQTVRDHLGQEWTSGGTFQTLGFPLQPPARTWRLRIDAALTARDGQTLGYPWIGFVENGHAPPSVAFEGSVWESAGGSQLPLIARNVLSITRSIAPITPSALMPTLLAHPRERRSLERPQAGGEIRRLNAAADALQAHGLDVRSLLSPQGKGLLWTSVMTSEALPGSVRRAVLPYERWPSRASTDVQVTNLGVSVKDSPQATLVFVTTLDTGLPVAGANVAIVDTKNETRWRGATDGTGVALAPPLALRPRDNSERFTFLVTAEKDGDFAYVGSDWVDTWTSELDYDLTESSAVFRGSVFTDRGAYRKNEEVRFKAMLRDDTPTGMRLLSPGAALDVVVNDGRGREVDRRTIKVNRWSSADWTWRVPDEAGLGYYRVQLSRAGEKPSYDSTVNGHFLVAAFRRPDFRVDASLTADPAILGSTLRGIVEAKYLFGAGLGARPVRWWSARHPVHGGTDAIRQRYPESRYAVGYLPSDEAPVRDGPPREGYEQLDAEGRKEIALTTTAEGDAAYSYRLEASVEDVAGQHIANRATFVMHPAAIYIAMSRPPMFVDTRNGTSVGLSVVDLAGATIPGVPVAVSLFREHWVSARHPDRRGLVWERREIPAGEWTVRSTAGESVVQIPVREGGCYTLRALARDSAGRQTRTELNFYATGGGVSSWRIEDNRINLTPERKTWKPGETARILIQSPWEKATALLTVEREGIRSHRTFAIKSTQDTVDVPITEADIPNVYVSVMLVKGRTSEEGDDDPGRPSYRVGYTQLAVDEGSKRLKVELSVDREEYRPRQPLAVSVALNRDGTPLTGEVTLWAMDYGLLSLTNYSTPDVLKAIYVPKALQVMTLDNRQRLMRRRALAPPPGLFIDAKGVAGGVAGELDEIVTVSSEALMSMGGVSVGQADTFPEIRSDFRPLVFWLGSVTTDAAGRASTTVTLPDSLTTYRVMAVAGDDLSRFGFGEREIRVTKPLSLLPAFPRFLTKGDHASFGAVVTNSGKETGTAVVTVQSLDPDIVQFGSAAKTMVSVGPGKSERVRFDAVARAAGPARIRMLVTLDGGTDAFEMPLVVSEPIRSEVTAAYGDTTATATEALALEPASLPGAGGLTVDLASSALVGVGESARYLEQYPYECAEQRASRALALLLAADLGGAFTLPAIQPDQYKTQAVRALDALSDYQCGSGGFALWPGRCGSESAYLTAYVLHVLKVAGTLKYAVDSRAIDRALEYLEQEVGDDPPEIPWWPVWAASEAYAVKVLAEFGRPQKAEIDRLTGMSERLPILALSYLADALAASNDRGPRYRAVLQRLINSVRVEADRAHVEETDEDALKWLWNTNVSATAVVLEGLSRRRDDGTLAAPLVRWLQAARTNGRWGTTHENAAGLEALVNYYRAFESDVPQMTATVKVGAATFDSVAFNGRSTRSEQVRVSMPELLKQVTAAASPTLSIAKTGTGRIYYTARVERFVPESMNVEDRGFQVQRRYERYVKDGSSPPATTFDAGDLIRVTTTVTLRGEGRYLALTDPLPAGVEAIDSWLQTTATDLAKDATRGNESDVDVLVAAWRLRPRREARRSNRGVRDLVGIRSSRVLVSRPRDDGRYVSCGRRAARGDVRPGTWRPKPGRHADDQVGQHHRAATIAAVTCLVVAVPPRSGVRGPPPESTRSIAAMIRSWAPVMPR